MKARGASTQRGVTLIELAVILVIVGLMLVVAIAVMPRLTERSRLNTTQNVTIYDVRQALISFAATNGRLPCPDTSSPPNGLEGSGASSGCTTADIFGRVPYRVLGFSDPVLDTAHLPLRYAVYRDAAADADLATLPNRFIPVLPGVPAAYRSPFPSDLCSQTGDVDINPDLSQGLNATPDAPNNTNDLDFCLALRNAKAAAPDMSYVFTWDLTSSRTPPFNDAFVLASGGVEDADGSGGDIAFDARNDLNAANSGHGIGYESPARRRGPGYDDIVYAMPFDQLESKLSCAAITVGVSSAANASIASAEMLVQAEDLAWLAYRNTVMDDLSVTQAGLGLTLAILQEIEAISDGIRAGLNTACPPTSEEAGSIPEAVADGVLAAVDIGLSAANVAQANAQTSLDDTVCAQTVSDVGVVQDMVTRIHTDAVNADQRGGQGNAPPSQSPPAAR